LRRPEIETHAALRPDFSVVQLAPRRVEIRRTQQYAGAGLVIHVGIELGPTPAVKTVRWRARYVEAFEREWGEFYPLARQVIEVQAVFIIIKGETPSLRIQHRRLQLLYQGRSCRRR
jgi:hypothetical protein